VWTIEKQEQRGNLKRSLWLWPILLIISAVILMVLVVADIHSPIRPVVALWFLLICPGMAIIRLLKLNDPSSEWVLAAATSLGLDALVSIVMLYAGFWYPAYGLLILSAVTIVGALMSLQMSFAPLAYSGWKDLQPAHQSMVIALLGGLTTAGVILIYLLVLANFHFL
jgi:uncharacterized membrane protein